MAVYGARKRKATAKRKARAKKAEPAKKRKKPKKAAAVRARAVKRGKRSLPKKVRAKRTPKRKVARRPRASAAKKRIRKKIAAKRPAVRARRKKVAAKRPAAPARRKKTAARPRPRPQPQKKVAATRARKKVTARTRKTKEQLQREHANITRQLEKIVAAEQKARETGKRSPERKEIRGKKKKLEEKRRKRVVDPKKIPFDRLKKTFHQKLKEAALPSKKYPHGQLPRLTKISRRINSDRNLGEQRRVRIKRILKPENVEDVLYKVRHAVQAILKSRREGYPQWLAKIAFSGQGDRLLGSGGKLLDVSEKTDATPDDQLFQTQGFDSTGTRRSEVDMLENLETILNLYADMHNTTVYLHYVLVMNFKFRRLR